MEVERTKALQGKAVPATEEEIMKRVRKSRLIVKACCKKLENEMLVEKFDTSFGILPITLKKKYKFSRNIRLNDIKYDLVALAKTTKRCTNRIFEIKYWPNILTDKKLADAVLKLKVAASEFLDEYPRDYVYAKIVIITKRSNKDDWRKRVMRYFVENINQSPFPLVRIERIEVLGEEDL